MPACVFLETQISSVMESLTRAAVAEICKLINTECVEMRLEIRRGQKEIEALKGKIRDLKKEPQNPALVAVSLIESRQEEDNKFDDFGKAPACPDKERKTKTHLSTPVKNVEENSLLNSGSTQTRMNRCGSGSGVPLKESQIRINSLNSEADIRGLNTAAIKVEVTSSPVSSTKDVLEDCQTDHQRGQNTHSHLTGDNVNHFGSEEALWSQSHYSAHFYNRHLPEDESNYKYETDVNGINGISSNEVNPNGLLLKTEENEKPLTSTSELASCDLMDTEALSWLPINFPVKGGAPGCSSMLQPTIQTSNPEQSAFHISATGEVEYTIEPEAKQAGGRNSQDRIQAAALRQSSTVPTMLTKSTVLPIADMRHKMFACSFCPKSFQSGADLKRHQRIHTGEKPYGCAVCGKRFSLRGNLVTHERAHSGSKPFICRLCGRAFAHGSNLRAHQRVHTGERPFHCSLCDKTFAWYYPFKRHLSLHFMNGQNS